MLQIYIDMYKKQKKQNNCAYSTQQTATQHTKFLLQYLVLFLIYSWLEFVSQ